MTTLPASTSARAAHRMSDGSILVGGSATRTARSDMVPLEVKIVGIGDTYDLLRGAHGQDGPSLAPLARSSAPRRGHTGKLDPALVGTFAGLIGALRQPHRLSKALSASR